MQKASGQQIAEYVLPLGLIVVMGGVLFSATSLPDLLRQQMGNALSADGDGGAMRVRAMGTLSNGMMPPALATEWSHLPSKVLTATLADGTEVNLQLANPEAVAETSGGRGITQNALSALDLLIEQLRQQDPEDPRIPPLAELSKRGHVIGDLQALIESTYPPEGFANGKARTDFYQTQTIEFNGQVMTIMAAGGQLNYYYGINEKFNEGRDELVYEPNNGFYENYKSKKSDNHDAPVISFMNQLEAIRGSDLFKDPTMKALINDVLARQIYMSSVQTLFAPTHEDVVTLVKKTKIGSDNICRVSRFVSCQDKG
jgi:hypothetical protein